MKSSCIPAIFYPNVSPHSWSHVTDPLSCRIPCLNAEKYSRIRWRPPHPQLVGGFNTPEKYESQLGWLFPTYGKIKHVPKPTSNHSQIIASLKHAAEVESILYRLTRYLNMFDMCYIVMLVTIVDHPQSYHVIIGGMVTIPSRRWFMALFYPHQSHKIHS